MRRLLSLAAGLAGLTAISIGATAAAPPVVPTGCTRAHLTAFPGRDELPLWSPSGKQLLFFRDRPDSRCLVVLDVATGALRGVPGSARAGVATVGDYSWAPRGSAIVFHTQRGLAVTGKAVRGLPRGQVGEVHWSRAGFAWLAHSHLYASGRQLTFGAAQDLAFSVSADGRRIAYERFPSPDAGGDLYVVPVQGGKPRLVARGVAVGDPAWSPDGQRLAFDRYSGGLKVFVVPANGGAAVPVTARGSFGPTWSPDGRWIAYAGGGVRIVRPDGTQGRLLAGRDTESVAWSPDSRSMAFERLAIGAGRGGIFTVRADGSGLRQLTREP
jgi:Tol biopolymer transport system component